MAILYQLISMSDVICKYRVVTFNITKEADALSGDISDTKYQWVFQPVNVMRYKKGGLRSKRPPFEYHIVDADGAKRFFIHKKVGLESIRAKIDTTFREDKAKQKNPFPKRWTPDLGTSTAQLKRKENKALNTWKRQEKWSDMLVEKKLLKITNAQVAVILTSYNRPTLVQKAIRSVLNQKYRDFKLYIIDNNSNPNVKKILRRYKKRNSSKIILHFLNTPNSQRLSKCWLSYMINWAIRRGKERYITLLTDDCWFTRTRLTHMVSHMNKHPSWMICYGTQIVVNKRGHHLMQRPADKIIPPRGGPAVIDHNQILFRRTLIKKIGYWNESSNIHNMNAPDAEFFQRIPYPIMPIPVHTDWFLKHGKSFQRYLQRGGTNRLTSGEIME